MGRQNSSLFSSPLPPKQKENRRAFFDAEKMILKNMRF
jgi:hypothetical protein